jgi:hypothetical protein
MVAHLLDAQRFRAIHARHCQIRTISGQVVAQIRFSLMVSGPNCLRCPSLSITLHSLESKLCGSITPADDQNISHNRIDRGISLQQAVNARVDKLLGPYARVLAQFRARAARQLPKDVSRQLRLHFEG